MERCTQLLYLLVRLMNSGAALMVKQMLLVKTLLVVTKEIAGSLYMDVAEMVELRLLVRTMKVVHSALTRRSVAVLITRHRPMVLWVKDAA